MNQYRKQSAKKDGLCPICKKCAAAAWAKDRDSNLSRLRRYNETPNGRAVHLVKNAKKRARIAGLKFDLVKEDVEQVLIKGVCQRTGVKFDFKSHDKFRNNPFAPSIDKIDPFGHYTRDNIAVVCFAYNIAKNQFSHEEFVDFCHKVVEFNK